MFGLKGRDTFNKPTSSIGMTVKKVGRWWVKSFPFILWIIVFYIVAIIGYTWYSYLYKKNVTEEEKHVYIDKRMSEVTFEKERFNLLKDMVSKRQERFDKQRDRYRDIFYERELLEGDVVEGAQKKPQKELREDGVSSDM
ncbi:MAG TPA: hypothetical protein EYG99_02685 [Candidatus Pacebacteria bacterium]|nr:hypothetical protein [Candidatus Paceibacterota bacterium]